MNYERWNGLRNINEMTEDDAIRGERAYANKVGYDGARRPVEIDTFWHMARTELGLRTPTVPLPKHVTEEYAAKEVARFQSDETSPLAAAVAYVCEKAA